LELPHRALAEVREAAQTLLATDGPRPPEVDLLLARCLGLEGAIPLETGLATDALPLLDRAAGVLDKLAEAGTGSRADLFITLACRALTKWAIGDWDGAEADWRSIIERLRLGPEEGRGIGTQMRWELEARVAMLAVDRGSTAAAIPRLELALSELEGLQTPPTASPSKTSCIRRCFWSQLTSKTHRLKRRLRWPGGWQCTSKICPVWDAGNSMVCWLNCV